MLKYAKANIDLAKNFKKFEKQITKACTNDGYLRYFNSKCYKDLCTRLSILDASNDLDFGPNNPDGYPGNFNMTVVHPVQRQRSILRRAMFDQDYGAEPLFTVSKTAATSSKIADNTQALLQHNFRVGEFRAKAFREIKEDVADYGVAVTASKFVSRQKKAWKTVMTPEGPSREFVPVQNSNYVDNIKVDPRNAFFDPDNKDAHSSYIQGYVTRYDISELIADYVEDPESYITENLKYVFEDSAKKAGLPSDFYYNPSSKDDIQNTYATSKVHVYIMWIKLNCIRGNEADQQYYYVECCKDKIIRFMENPYDEDLVPIVVYNFLQRRDTWWGNTDAEFSIPHEKFLNILLSMSGENAIRSMDQLLLYEKGSIDTADWNERHVLGGLVGVKVPERKRLSDMLYPYQPQDMSLMTTNAIMEKLYQNLNELSTKPDLNRSKNLGGIKNTTATAVQVLEEQSDIKENYYRRGFAFSLRRLARVNTIILRQMLGDEFDISPKSDGDNMHLYKYQILGDVIFNIETALTKNKAIELTKLQNFLTQLMNFKGTQDPVINQINLEPAIKKWLVAADIGDVDEMMPTNRPNNFLPFHQQNVQQQQQQGLPQNMAMLGAAA